MKEQEIINIIAKTAVGIGDDCAVIPKNKTTSLVITTDVLNEKVHFLPDHIPPQDLGYKALAVNLSDIAAMGATPKHAFLTLSLPKTSKGWVESFMKGFNEVAKEHKVQLMGGDTTRAETISIGITVVGEAKNDAIKYRDTARAGDIICTTDNLGDAATGLGFILSGLKKPEAMQLIQRHYRPCPHIAEGQWLAAQQGVHAMMDVSDGLDEDLTKLTIASGCGAQVQLKDIPMSDAMQNVTKDPFEFSVFGGENYCLLLTVGKDQFKGIAKAYQAKFKTPLHAIGEIDEDQGVRYYQDGKLTKLKGQSYQHFDD